jgi:hypothetical protein
MQSTSQSSLSQRKGKGKEIIPVENIPPRTEQTNHLVTSQSSTSKLSRSNNTFIANSREDAAFKRLYDYEERLTLEEAESFSIDNIDNTNPKPTFSNEHLLITRWASKFTNIKNKPHDLLELVAEIHASPKGFIKPKPHMPIFIKIEARDKSFFRSFRKMQDFKSDHQLDFENLEQRFHSNYKKKNNVSQLNRETRQKIRLMIRASLFISYLRFINLYDLNPYLLAQILEYGCNFFYWEKENKTVNYYELLEESKKMYQDILPALPNDYTDIPRNIRSKISQRIPIWDRSTTSSVARSLRQYYKFSLLPESYFKTLPPLPDKPSGLSRELSYLFPIKERKELKDLGRKIRELRRFYIIPDKIPTSYFNLPPRKIPLPLSYNQLNDKFIQFFPLDPSTQSIKDIVSSLREIYYFKSLPSSFFKNKKCPLPFSSHSIPNFKDFGISVPTSNIDDTKQLISILQCNYLFNLPLGPQWVLPEI